MLGRMVSITDHLIRERIREAVAQHAGIERILVIAGAEHVEKLQMTPPDDEHSTARAWMPWIVTGALLAPALVHATPTWPLPAHTWPGLGILYQLGVYAAVGGVLTLVGLIWFWRPAAHPSVTAPAMPAQPIAGDDPEDTSLDARMTGRMRSLHDTERAL